MGRQRNMPPTKGQNKAPEQELNKTEPSSPPGAEREGAVVGTLKELREKQMSLGRTSPKR